MLQTPTHHLHTNPLPLQTPTRCTHHASTRDQEVFLMSQRMLISQRYSIRLKVDTQIHIRGMSAVTNINLSVHDSLWFWFCSKV